MPKSTRTSAFWFCMPHSYAVRILVVNVNTTAAMTEAIAASAKSAAGPQTEILPLTPDVGADSVEGNFESYLAAVAVMDAVTRYPDPFDAVVQAGFGEHGREGLQELLDVPVVDITEAAAHVACLVGHVSPDFAYWVNSGDFVFVAVLGGTGSVLAPFVGSIAFEFVKNYAVKFSPHTWQMTLGVFLLLVIYFQPQGLWHLLTRLRTRRS